MWFGGKWIVTAAAGVLCLPSEPAAQAQTQAQASERLAFTAHEGTWMQPDISPDGQQIVFDLLGDIYAMPVTGGSATPILTGTAFETHPAFSPDGRRIAFVSDRSGTIDLWIADADGGNPRPLSRETGLNVMAQPAWSADGTRVFVSRMVHSLLGFELWSFPVDGGEGERITRAQPNGDDGWDQRYNAIGVVAAADGALWYAAKRGDTFIPKPADAWFIVRRTADGMEETKVAGGAIAPALSHDGQWLAYATREGGQTVLRLRGRYSGEDRRLTTLDPDGRDGGYYGGVLPRFRWFPGDDALLLSRDGGFERIALADGTASPIPFSAPVDLAIERAPRRAIAADEGPVRVRVIQTPALSPDGGSIALSALGHLYLVQGDRAPQALTEAGDEAYMPAWSPDGSRLAYIRWTADGGGAVWSIATDGTAPVRHTATRAFYTEPAFSPDGRFIAALRASHDDRVAALTELVPDRPTAIVVIDLASGQERVLAQLPGARLLQWSANGRTLDFYGPDGLQTVPLAGGAATTVARIVGQAPSQYVGAPVPVDEARLSPDRREVLIRHASQLWRAPIPVSSGIPDIDLTTLPPSARLTRVGADSAAWTGSGGIVWSVGATVRHLPPGMAENAERAGTLRTVAIELPRAVPPGSMVLRHARLLTMRQGEVIEDGEIVITGDRIVGVGKAGTQPVPPGARVVDLTGRTLVPGLIDAHAHWWQIRRGVHGNDSWPLALTLAFGVTAGLDVQPFTTDIFAYQDRIDAGLAKGPRVFSTGPGLFRNAPLENEADIAAVLARHRDHYGTHNLKAYMVGTRATRRRVARVAASMGMLATTEGASDLPLGLTHFIDGFAGNEHNLPVSPLHDDVIRLMVATRTSYTPTFAVLYGGGNATNAMIDRTGWRDDPRIRTLMPGAAMAAAIRDHQPLPGEAEDYRRFASDALRIQRAGGLVALGSHGEMHGLGMHWEMHAFVEGGATPMEALKAATIGSAEAIGRHDSLGSIEPGKFADLIVLSADPRENIHNSLKIEHVIKAGAFAE